MAGYNRYDLGGKKGGKEPSDFLDVLSKLDRGWTPPKDGRPIVPTRELARKPITTTRPSYVKHLDEILPYGRDSRVEAEIEHEYLPFSMAKLSLPSCDADAGGRGRVRHRHRRERRRRGLHLLAQHAHLQERLPLHPLLARVAALIKVPSRITTFVEMALAGSRNGTQHVAPLRGFESPAFSLYTCDIGETGCSSSFRFSKNAKLRLFRGKPSTINDVTAALASLA